MNEQEYNGLVIRHNKNRRNLIISVLICISSFGLVRLFEFFSNALSAKTSGEFTTIDNATGGEVILSIVLVLLMLLFTIIGFIAIIFIIANTVSYLKSLFKISKLKNKV